MLSSGTTGYPVCGRSWTPSASLHREACLPGKRASGRWRRRFGGRELRVHALEPDLAPVRIDGARAEPAAEAQIAGTNSAVERDRLRLQLDPLTAVVVDQPPDPPGHSESA